MDAKVANNRTTTESAERLSYSEETVRNSTPTPYPNYGQEFYGYILKILLKKGLLYQDALEQTQEIYVKVITCLRNGNALPTTPGGWKAYLGAAARCQHFNFYREQNGRAKEKRGRMVPSSTFDKDDKSAWIDRLDRNALLKGAGEKARTRWLLLIEEKGGPEVVNVVMLAEQQYDREEIAYLLNVSVKTVKRRIDRARKIVKRALSA